MLFAAGLRSATLRLVRLPRLQDEPMATQTNHPRADIERMRQESDRMRERVQLCMERFDEEIARSKKLYDMKI